MDKEFINELTGLLKSLGSRVKEIAVRTRSGSQYTTASSLKTVVNEVSLDDYAVAQYCMSCIDMTKHTLLSVPQEGVPSLTK